MKDQEKRINDFKNEGSAQMGRFEISQTFIGDSSIARASGILKDVFIIRAESMFHKNTIEYIAFGEMFDKVSFGAEIPFYDLIIEEAYDPEYPYILPEEKITWKRREKNGGI